MKKKIAKTVIGFFVLFGMIIALSACVSNDPVPMTAPDAVEHSHSKDQVRAQDGVELLIQNKELADTLVISDVALVRGQYVRQFRARISNNGKHTLEIRTDPVWFNEHGVQMSNVYNQQQVFRIAKGQGISISHDATSHSARTIRLILDCPDGSCRVKD